MSAPYKVDLMNTGSELCRAWVTQGRRVICIANGMQGLTVTEMNREVRERGEKIARALALLDRVGDAAADDVAALVEWARRNPEAWAGLKAGTAAVVPVEPTIEMVRASNPVDDAQDLLAHFTLHEGIAAGRLDKENDDA